MYKIDISIHNDLGELVDKRFTFETLEEMGNSMGEKMFGITQEAIDYAIENNMFEEELKSKEEHEFDKEDDTDEAIQHFNV